MKKIIAILILATLPISPKSRKSMGKNIRNNNSSPTQTIKKPAPKPVKLVPVENTEISLEKEKPVVQKLSDEPDKVYLNFENAELINFINYVAELKQVNILPDKGISGNRISLDIRKPVTVNQAWNILHTITEMSGFTIVKSENIYKIVPNAGKSKEVLPSYINVPVNTLPDTDESIRYVSFLNNVRASEVQTLVSSMLNNPVIVQEDLNGMVLIDKSNNIKSAIKIIHELDKTGLQESVTVIKLKEANATEVRDLLKSLMAESKPSHPLAQLLNKRKQTPSTYFSPNTKIIAEERTNALILLGTKQSNERIETFVVENIDKRLKTIESPLHIYELQYADAKSVVELLKEVTSHPESAAGQQAEKYGAVRSGAKYFKPMKFKADEKGNRIIVSTTDQQDWELLQETIKNLDKPQPSVAVECLIVTVDTSDDKSFGGQTRNKPGMLGKHANFQSTPVNQTVLEPNTGTAESLLGDLISGITGGLGKTLLTFGRDGNVWSIFEMLNRQVNTNLVAQPFLTVANKFKASIEIGETRRIDSGDVITSGGDTVTGKEDAYANLELHVTPQINIDGVINLNVEIKKNDFKDTPENRDIRTFKTDVSVADGQVVALSGFVKTKVVETTNKTPVLGSVPLLGWFFKNKSKTITKQNILVFLAPTIIKPRQMPGYNLYTKMKLDIAKKSVGRSVVTGSTNQPIHDWLFDTKNESYDHKVDDYAQAKYQPTTVDINNDPYYRTMPKKKVK